MNVTTLARPAPKAAKVSKVRATAPIALGVREPPREFQLWQPGPNPTDYGVHVWNERSVTEVMARYQERGNPLLLDVEHAGATTLEGDPAVTAGYARLEVRAGAPWLIFDWSEYGRTQIQTGERRFLSPEYDVDKNTGEILALYRVSLVADPGTHRARMLASASLTEKKNMDDPTLAAIEAIIDGVSDPAEALASIKKTIASLKGDGDEADDPADDATVDEEIVAAADDDDKDAKEKKAAGAAKAPKPAPAKPAPATDSVSAAAVGAAVVTVQNATRDHLLEVHGEKLEPSIRRWASAQPLAVVKSYLDSMPADAAPKQRTRATAGNGGIAGLSERELQKCKASGMDPAKYAALKAKSAAVGGT